MSIEIKRLIEILRENNLTAEDALFSAYFVVEIESSKDLEILKAEYELKGEGYYLKVSNEGEDLELSKKGFFFADLVVPSSQYIKYILKK